MNERDIWPIKFFNQSSETIPAHGVMRCVDSKIVDGDIVLVMNKPNTYGSQYSCYINGRVAVPGLRGGQCSSGTNGPVLAAFEGATPDFGDLCGPVLGEWKIVSGVGGFICRGEKDGGKLVYVERSPLLMIRGKASGASSKNDSSSIMTVYHDAVSTSYTVTYYNPYGDILDTADMRVDWVNNQWEAGMAECEVS